MTTWAGNVCCTKGSHSAGKNTLYNLVLELGFRAVLRGVFRPYAPLGMELDPLNEFRHFVHRTSQFLMS